MNQRRIVVLLITIMALACLSISGVALLILYRTSMQEERARLMETAQSQARLIEAIARFDKQYNSEYPGGAKSATISQVVDAHENYITFGETGEFVIGERVEEQIVFLCRHRHEGSSIPEPIPFISDLAEPMREALSGVSRTMVGLDYEGKKVLAACEPVDEIDIGIVAKIDLAEIRAPFVSAGLIVLLFTVIVVLIGAGLFTRVAGPVVVRLEEQNAAVNKLNQEMTTEIAERKRAVEALGRSEHELTIRTRISDIFLTAPEQDMFREVMKVVLELSDSECGAFAYIDAGGTQMVPVHKDGRRIKNIVSPEGAWGGDTWTMCLQERKAFISEGPFDLPTGHIPLTRVMAVPIVHQEAAIGGIMVGNRPSPYNEGSTRQLKNIADFVAPVLAAKIRQEHLERKRQAAENELQKAHDRLEHRVEERTAQLRRNENLLQHVFDGIPNPLFLLDKEMRIKILNKAASKYYHIEKADAIGIPCHLAFSRCKEPCEGCRVTEAIKKQLNISFERRGMKDPNRLEQVTIYHIDSKGGASKGAILRIQDITEDKLLERREAQHEKLASLGLMVSSIAHEIANPVSAVTFNAPILNDYIDAMLPILDDHAHKASEFEVMQMPYSFFRKDVNKIVHNILHAAHRIKATMDDLRRLYIQREARTKAWVHIGDIIEESKNVIGVEFDQSITYFNVNIPENMPEMYTDVEAMEQVLTNLLTNAMHAADTEASRVAVDVSLGPTWKEYFIIEVKDNGSGMDAESLAMVFKPFFTTKAPAKGSGLGLYVCRDLLEGLDGKIHVASEPGKGTVVRIVLPDVERRSVKRLQ